MNFLVEGCFIAALQKVDSNRRVKYLGVKNFLQLRGRRFLGKSAMQGFPSTVLQGRA